MEADQIKARMDFVFSTYPPHLGATARFARLGEDLASIIGRDAPFSRSYCSTAYHNDFGEGKEAGELFCRALEALTAALEGNVPALIAAARSANVTTWATNEIEGAFVMSAAKLCAMPGCNVRFIGNVPWRRYCPAHGVKR